MIYTKRALYALSGRLVAAGSQFLLTIAITRLLGKSDAGLFFSVYIWILLASGLGQCGLSVVSLRISQIDKTELPKKIIAIILVAIVAAVSLGASSLLLINSIIDVFLIPGVKLYWLVAWAAGMAINQVVADLNRGLDKQITAAVVGCIGTLSLLLCFTAALLNQLSFGNLFLIAGINWTVVAILSIASVSLSARHGAMNVNNSISIRHLGKTAKEACASMPTSIVAFIATQADQLVLSNLYAAPVYAVYAAGLKATQVFGIVANMINTYVGPILLSQIRENKKNVQLTMARNNRCVSILIAPSIIVLVFFSRDIMALLFGNSYEGAAPIFTFFILAQAFNICSGPKGFLLWLMGYERTVMLVMSLFGLLILAMCFSLSALISIELLALAIAFLQVAQYLIEGILLKKISRLDPFKL